MLECNIDDMNSEFYEHAMDRLFKAGALDVFLSSIVMKKSRPAVKLSVLARQEDIEKLSGIIFSETSTIGIRRYAVEREVLDRKVFNIDTRFGCVRVKCAYQKGNLVNYAPEYEDIKNAALNSGASIKEVYNEALIAFVDCNRSELGL